MKARKALGWLMFGLVMLMVAGFLALHTLNLFTFVFPSTQSQWAWLGFGFTSLGAIGYLVDFLWLAKTTLQKVVAVIMAFVSFVSEAVAAFFGMQVETYRKIGFSLTEQEVNTILTIIGILGVLHFFALIAHFAGDKIIELFGDHDGDGISNYQDPDYLEWKRQQAAKGTPAPNTNGKRPALRQYTLPEILTALHTDETELANLVASFNGNPQALYSELSRQGAVPADLGMINFVTVVRKLPNPT